VRCNDVMLAYPGALPAQSTTRVGNLKFVAMCVCRPLSAEFPPKLSFWDTLNSTATPPQAYLRSSIIQKYKFYQTFVSGIRYAHTHIRIHIYGCMKSVQDPHNTTADSGCSHQVHAVDPHSLAACKLGTCRQKSI